MAINKVHFGLWINRLPMVKEYVLKYAALVNCLESANYMQDVTYVSTSHVSILPKIKLKSCLLAFIMKKKH